MERGWLERSFIGEEIMFALSSAGVTALELGVPMGDARTAMN